jgi:hypothetical protein
MAKVAQFKHLFTKTVKPTAAVTRCRFTDKNGDMLTTAGARACGVSTETLTADDITNSLPQTIVILGIAELEAGGVITPTDKVTTDNVGRGVAATAGQCVNAYPIITANTATGDRFSALLVFEADPVVSAFVADPAGGATVDAESRAAIAAILDILIAQKLMAAS